MKISKILFSTSKESVSDVDIVSQELLIRAGYIKQLSAGVYTAMHFGFRSFEKIKNIIREEMNAIGGVEMSMPIVHPAELWRKTGRYDAIDESLVRFKDRTEKDLVLAMTHEEVVASVARADVKSYRHLPLLIYQIQTKYRDEARARGGLIRVKEFEMKDSYSLDKDWAGLEKQYQHHYKAYFSIFKRCGLPVIAIQSDVGMMGGRVAHEYMYLTEIGEDTIYICESTGYQANKEVATIKKEIFQDGDRLPLEKVHTPGTKTIRDLCLYLGIQPEQTGKVVFYAAHIEREEKIVMAIVRGDMDVNQIKLQNLIKAQSLIPASEDQIRSIRSVPGYASPINIIQENTLVAVDDLIPQSINLVMGANEEDYHLLNVCYERDYAADFIGDIINAYDGALAPDASTDQDILQSVRGVEVGNIFQLGTKYTEGLEAHFMNEQGRSEPIIMGSYGIGIGRLLGCLAQEHHDGQGLRLPIAIAPYQVVLIGLLQNEDVIERADLLYHQIKDEGIEILFDDRGKKVASPGEKFADADLMGIPIQLTISKRSLSEGGIELKLRSDQERRLIPETEVITQVRLAIKELQLRG